MAKQILNFTGTKGLVDNFFGDINDTTSKPHLRHLSKDGQMADGVYNPLRMKGYLTPANNTFAALTGTITDNIIARVYDSTNDDLYLAEEGRIIQKLDGLNDSSLTSVGTITATDAVISDLSTYELNGVPKLYYVYRSKTPLGIFNMVTNVSADVNIVQIGGKVLPAGSAEPVLTASARDNDDNLSTTISKAITVPSGTNQVGIAYFFAYDNTYSHNSATWNGVAMSSAGSGSGSFADGMTFRWGAYKIANPTSGTVTGTWGGTVPNRVVHLYVFDDADQTTMYSSSGSEVNTGTSGTYDVDVTADYQVPIVLTFSETASHSQGSGQIEVFNAANDYGSDSSSYFSTATQRLRVGVADLPFANQDDDWLTSTATGAFIDTTTSDNNFIVNADNGYSYLFNEYRVHKIDGTEVAGATGSITQDVLLFPSYINCVDAIDTGSLMYIGIQSSPITTSVDSKVFNADTMGVYIWDRLSTIVNIRDFIPIYGAKEIKKIFVNKNGELRVITVGEDRFTEVRALINGRLTVIKRLGLKAYPQRRDGVEIMNNLAVWLGEDGIIYGLGEVDGTEEVYKLGDITGQVSGTLASGMIFSGNTDATQSRQSLLISCSDTSPSNKLLRWYPHGIGTINSVAQTGHIGNTYLPVTYLPSLATLKHLFIYCAPGTDTGTTAVATLKFYANQSSTPFMTKTVTYDDVKKGYLSYELNKPFVNAFQIEVEHGTSHTLGANDFCPSVGVLEYTPTLTLK